MVHWENIPYILAHGICCREHNNADPNYINIGHNQLIVDRHDYPINLPNAGNLGEYVPFYFAGHSPMLYLIMNGYQGVKQLPQDDIIFIVVNFEAVTNAGLEYVFTDRNAKIAIARYFSNPADLDELKWEIVNSKDWKNSEEDLQRRDFKQAEFLIRREVPIELIYTLVVKSDERKIEVERSIEEAGLLIPVRVARPGKLYY